MMDTQALLSSSFDKVLVSVEARVGCEGMTRIFC